MGVHSRPGGSQLRGFPPILDRHVERLILGSFPSAASLAAGQYYAHPQNQFWVILGHLLDEPLPRLSYPDRTERVLAHRVGIWDVYGACDRAGSADAHIRNARPNALLSLRRRVPALWSVAFNGSAAGRFQPLFDQAGLDTAVLPSSSRAHASRSLEEKLELWRVWWRRCSPASTDTGPIG